MQIVKVFSDEQAADAASIAEMFAEMPEDVQNIAAMAAKLIMSGMEMQMLIDKAKAKGAACPPQPFRN